MGGKFFKETIANVPLDGATVLVRADYNVPLDTEGKIRDDLRIRASLPTLRALLKRGCKLVIISHLGRPEGKSVTKYSLAPVAIRLSELLGRDVVLAKDCVGDSAYQTAKRSSKNVVVLFENLRFHSEEEQNDETFAREIAKASGASYFVQDGFGVVHRAHASTEAITHYLPSVAGLLLEKEYTIVTQAMENPARPLVAILGGAKVSDKIGVIERLVEKADQLVIGGAMANTFLAHKGYAMGKSKVEDGQSDTIDRIMEAAAKKVGESLVDSFFHLPSDVAVAQKLEANEPRIVVAADQVGADQMALDIGTETITAYEKVVANAGTVIWNGPLGYSELPNFAHGSARMALTLATHPSIRAIVGGGDTADFVLKWDGGTGESFYHISTGGGAGLDLMAGKLLPGVESLLDARK